MFFCIKFIDHDRDTDGRDSPDLTQDHIDAAHLCQIVLQVVDSQISLRQHTITISEGPIVGKQVIVRNFLRVAHLVVFDLIQIDALSELVGLTEGDHGHFMLARQVGNH